MTPERWQSVKAVLAGALARATRERAAYLDHACGTDIALRREVESLLSAGEATHGFLEPSLIAANAAEESAHPRVAANLMGMLQAALAGRYTVAHILGAGGMATVFLAHDLRHDRPVALKVVHPDLAVTLGPERFQREIRTTARLQHPHILPVLDSGEAAGQLWYTMPYVDGESLRDRLGREGQLPLDDALQIGREVADALGYAHNQGIVHRDIKPENILLSRGHALVADFGIARAMQAADAEHLTATGVTVGTPAYMSPEQADGASSVDGRSDLYSLGCVLYEMLTGEVPYTGRTPQAVIAKRVLEPLPHVRTLRASVPEAIEQAINRALAVTPADRFGTAAEFAKMLAQPATTSGATTIAPTAPTVTVARWRGVPRWLIMVALGILLGAGALLAWLRSRPRPGDAAPKRLAVLPFENLGRSEDEYFADGVTDEVRGKLTALAGLEVIARASSRQYKRTTKSLRQIGQELGVDYLLTGTVRWEKDSAGPGRVRVSPELVQVSTASTRWQEPFEVPLTDVFAVQADVAARVAGALGLALGAGERRRLAERPTENLAAYDAFLKGEGAAEGHVTFDLESVRRAIDYYQRAVALDSSFALAWAQLSRALSGIYWNAPTVAGAAAARQAAERALALAPERPEGHWALADYYRSVRHDPARALTEAARGHQLAPTDAGLLSAMGWSELNAGRLEAALAHFRKAQALDPRSAETATLTVYALGRLREYPEALKAADQGLAVDPSNLGLIHAKVEAYLGQGDLSGARAVLRAVPREVDPAALVPFIANWDDLYWVLDDEQQRLLVRLSPAPFGEDRAAWGLALAETFALRQNADLARIYADSARIVYSDRLRQVPGDAGSHAYLGLALAYMGRRVEAMREGERGVSLAPINRDAWLGSSLRHQLARIYLLLDEPEKALGQLEPLLNGSSYYLSPGWLRVDPTFGPLRGNPRFERLVNGQ